MSELLLSQNNRVQYISLNRPEKRNAFDEALMRDLNSAIEAAVADPSIRLLCLKAEGEYFSAGADLGWMQRTLRYSEAENLADAAILAELLDSLYRCPKPTLAIAQGSAFGGGVGLLAACDIVIAANEAQFCFSEVKLGLIPAVISPYVIEAIGARRAKQLFLSAETFTTQQAIEYQLVQHGLPSSDLETFASAYIEQLLRLAPEAQCQSKAMVREFANQPISQTIRAASIEKIAKKRVSAEAQKGLQAFLSKQAIQWD